MHDYASLEGPELFGPPKVLAHLCLPSEQAVPRQPASCLSDNVAEVENEMT